MCERIGFSRSFVIQVPLALNVAIFFQSIEQRIDSAGSEINPKILSNAGDDLISMHGFRLQELEDHEIQETPH